LVVGAVATLTLAAAHVQANPISALIKLAKGASAVKAAGSGAKAVTAAKAVAIGGSALAAERAAGLFAVIPDDAARLATYVTHADGELAAVGRNLETITGAQAIERARNATDLYLDIPAALNSQALATAPEARLFVLNASGQPVKVERLQVGDVVEFVVDGTDAALTISEFAVDQLENRGTESADTSALVALPMLPARCTAGVREALGGAIPEELEEFSRTAVNAYLATERESPLVVLTVDELMPEEFTRSLTQSPNRFLIAVISEPCTPAALVATHARLSEAQHAGTRVPFLKEPAFDLRTWTAHEAMAGFGKFKSPTQGLSGFGFVIPFRESASNASEVPLYFKLGGGLFIVGFIGYAFKRARKKQAAATAV
jgi:hypothetical protein